MLQVEEERRHADQYKEQVGFSKTFRIHPEFGIVQNSGFLGILPFKIYIYIYLRCSLQKLLAN